MKHQRRGALLALAFTMSTTVAVIGAASPAVAAPPAAGVERSVTTARPANGQAEAAVAWNGSVYLVVWEEQFSTGAPTAIYGARVSANGTVLDPNGFRISAADQFDSRSRPTVAAGPKGFLVVYQYDPEETYSDLYATIVGGNGSIVRPEWRFRAVDNDQLDPAVAWNGSRFLVTWQDGPDPSDPDIFAARAFADGRSFDGCSFERCPDSQADNPGIPIYATYGELEGSYQTRPVVAAVGGRFQIAWEDTETATAVDVRGARFSSGKVVDVPPFTVSGAPAAQEEPAIAANGSALLTAWTDRRGGTGRNVWGDVSVDGRGADFMIGGGAGAQYEPTVARRGNAFLVAWTDTRNGNADIYASRVTTTGGVREPNGVAIARSAAAEFDPAAALGTQNKQLVAYTKAGGAGGPDRIKFRLVG